MICKKCGKEIGDEFKFCGFCGADIEKDVDKEALSEDLLTENVNVAENEEEEDRGFLIKLLGVCLLVLVVGIIIALCVSSFVENGLDDNKKDTPSYGESKRYAKASDLVISFKRNDKLFENDEYYMIIQAQEKITGLELEIDYKTSGGKYIKTETVYVGKVVPGNQYRFELSQNGMDPSYLNKTEKFSYRVISGTIEE